ncbi:MULTISPECIES: YchJ family protein [unclassified Shewanella]|uniref:YchJ family protein n=1 Tax=unclassified Shewanella TaxID=196818 RepID=UPI000C84C241|nr:MULTISPECIES: YchJ family protein [unclassified Shewanella]MDO6640669.1 YchJ family protein [Shewanella sp. 5_MG-2023]MDO6776455.1 YchJ family protein [Shewanella sp. 3_MG-2023]PMG28351.1 hypothetical protein BCU94_16795 [Shewanella sp. 10N.286.52.C2]PMG47362.1 hypothetical protein BCU91_03175 [Shewanella sp. 10N.286.52.B9]PMH89394.1 hypothetical protein BCU57_00600 [Shewanella sp. 10N.286.48.B5]
MTTKIHCPCGSDSTYEDCCKPYHSNVQVAATAEILMRSRYCAFVLQHYPYLIETHHANYRGGLSINDLSQGAELTRWLGLEVINFEPQDELATATVTFKAWFYHDGEIDAIYEKSQFVREDAKWFYTTGEQFNADLPKRNDPCICHSGKKFKACCMKLTG